MISKSLSDFFKKKRENFIDPTEEIVVLTADLEHQVHGSPGARTHDLLYGRQMYKQCVIKLGHRGIKPTTDLVGRKVNGTSWGNRTGVFHVTGGDTASTTLQRH